MEYIDNMRSIECQSYVRVIRGSILLTLNNLNTIMELLLFILMLIALGLIIANTIKEHRKPAVPFVDDDIDRAIQEDDFMALRTQLKNLH